MAVFPAGVFYDILAFVDFRQRGDVATALSTRDTAADMRTMLAFLWERDCGDTVSDDFTLPMFQRGLSQLLCGKATLESLVQMRNNKVAALVAVRKRGSDLWYASEALQNDRDVVLAAVRQEGAALRWASKELQADSRVVKAAVEQYGEALAYASWEMRDDRQVVLAAMEQDPRAIVHTSKRLRSEFEDI